MTADYCLAKRASSNRGWMCGGDGKSFFPRLAMDAILMMGKRKGFDRGEATPPSPRGSDPSFPPEKCQRLHRGEATTPLPPGSDAIKQAAFTRAPIPRTKPIPNSIFQALHFGHGRQLLPSKESIIQLWLDVWWRWKELSPVFGDERHIDNGEAKGP